MKQNSGVDRGTQSVSKVEPVVPKTKELELEEARVKRRDTYVEYQALKTASKPEPGTPELRAHDKVLNTLRGAWMNAGYNVKRLEE